MLIACMLPYLGQAVAAGSSRFFWHPEIAPSGPTVILVSLDEQDLYVYRNGVVIGVSPISSGRRGHETPPGVYSILQKQRMHRSNLYDNAPMPFMQRLTWNGIALHGGVLTGRPASHGCVRLPQPFAERLFEVTRRGGIVVVAKNRIFPANMVHPAAVAPIDIAGQPMRQPDEALLPNDATAKPGDIINVVVSTRDRQVYVLRNGLLVARSPLTMQSRTFPAGTLLYVMRVPTGADPKESPAGTLSTQWFAFRILGSGPVPEPAVLARQLHVPPHFGERLRHLLGAGTTVLVTDLSGQGGSHESSMRTVLASEEPPVP